MLNLVTLIVILAVAEQVVGQNEDHSPFKIVERHFRSSPDDWDVLISELSEIAESDDDNTNLTSNDVLAARRLLPQFLLGSMQLDSFLEVTHRYSDDYVAIYTGSKVVDGWEEFYNNNPLWLASDTVMELQSYMLMGEGLTSLDESCANQRRRYVESCCPPDSR